MAIQVHLKGQLTFSVSLGSSLVSSALLVILQQGWQHKVGIVYVCMYVYYMHELVRGDDDDDLGYICVSVMCLQQTIYMCYYQQEIRMPLLMPNNSLWTRLRKEMYRIASLFFLFTVLPRLNLDGDIVCGWCEIN